MKLRLLPASILNRRSPAASCDGPPLGWRASEMSVQGIVLCGLVIVCGAAGFPGGLVTIWCGLHGWEKGRQRALFQPFILLTQVATLVLIGLARPAGPHALGVDATALLCIPASLLGTRGGMALYRRMSDAQFALVVNLLLIVSGLSYLL